MNFKDKVADSLSHYKRTVLKTDRCGMFGEKEYSHILCEDEREKNLSLLPEGSYEIAGNVLKFTKINHAPIKLHRNWYHLNSSQILCLSYFYRFIENLDLLRAFCEHYGFGEPSGAELEWVMPDGTNVDFVIHLKNGGHVFLEIKYTEQDFGGVSFKRRSKTASEVLKIYRQRYDRFYSGVKISETDYLKHYQVVRNISLSHKSTYNTTVFLVPSGNCGICKSLQAGLDAIENKETFRYAVLYWEDIVSGELGDVAVCKKYFEF